MSASMKNVCGSIKKRHLPHLWHVQWLKHEVQQSFYFLHAKRTYSTIYGNQRNSVFLSDMKTVHCLHFAGKYGKNIPSQRFFSTASCKLDNDNLSKTEKKKARKEAKKQEMLERKILKTEKQKVF